MTNSATHKLALILPVLLNFSAFGYTPSANAVESTIAEKKTPTQPSIPPSQIDETTLQLDVALFSSGNLDEWEEKSFKGKTRYQLKEDANQGTVLHALSQGSASVIGKRVKVDLTQTPYLNWRWKIDNRLEGIDETKKSGDDFVARIYLVKTDGLFGRKSKAVNYVWSSNQSTGSTWSNAYQPGNSKMVAVRGIENSTGQWVSEKRNVAIDFMQLFGKDIRVVDLVVIMSDTDNSGLTASASYGDIYFSSQ